VRVILHVPVPVVSAASRGIDLGFNEVLTSRRRKVCVNMEHGNTHTWNLVQVTPVGRLSIGDHGVRGVKQLFGSQSRFSLAVS